MDCNNVWIIDTRIPMYPVAELAGHSEYVNDVAWAPTSKYVHNVKKDLILF